MSPDPDTLARTLAFERELVASVSTRMVPFAWGTAYLNDGYRERWDSNFLWVDGTAEQVDAGALAAEAERVLGDAGLTHREIRIDDDAYGRSVAAGLARAGYGGDRLVVMEQRRTSDRPESALEAEEIDLAALRPALEIVLQREPWATSDEIVRMLADFRGELERHAGARFFCARVDGEIAAMCELYVRGSIGPDRGREHPRGVPQPRARARGGAARCRRRADGGRGDGVPARARRRLAEGVVREARLRSDRIRVVVRATVVRVGEIPGLTRVSGTIEPPCP